MLLDEVCEDLEQFEERLEQTQSIGQFPALVRTFVETADPPTEESVEALVQYSDVCWMPVARWDTSSEDAHVYQRRATRCLGCTEFTELFIWDSSDPSFVLGCQSGEVAFTAHYIQPWYNKAWVHGRHIALQQPELHDVITRTALVAVTPPSAAAAAGNDSDTLFPAVLPPFYAYGCAGRGVVLEWHDEFIELVAKAWDGAMDAWLDALETVRGFLVAPSAAMFNTTGRIVDLSALCWSHPANPTVRWMAPMKVHPARMRLPEAAVDHVELRTLQGTRRWFYEAVRWELPLEGSGRERVRTWNRWVTWCSLGLGRWAEGQRDFLKPIQPKEPLHSADACVNYLLSTFRTG